MKIRKLILTASWFVFLAISIQSEAQINPNINGTAADHVVVTPSKSMKIAGVQSKLERNPKLKERSYPFIDIAFPKGNDPVWQRTKASSKASAALANIFEGQTTGSYPPDCNGAIGPNHYIQTINTTYAIYDKISGSEIQSGQLSDFFPASLTGGGGNDGDPIVLYDEVEQRWLVSQFKFSSPYYMLIAISRTDDPTGEWDSYSFSMNGGPDYMKFGIWRDGYYMSTNTTSGSDVYVFEKNAMMAGAEAPKYVGFNNTWRPTTIDGFHCIMPLDNDFTQAVAGAPGLFITMNDDAIGGGSDQLWIYECDVDWDTPANSTFNRVQQIGVASFDSNFGADWENIMQPNGNELDAIPQVLMFRAQYLNFGSYQTIVACHTVDVNATDRAGIRWYELRKTEGDWEIRQQSTYSPDEHSRWMGSISMNQNGEIGLGYSIASSAMHPGIRVTGQTVQAHDAANGILDVPEKIIHDGTVSQTSAERWGDYSEMTVDPSNGTTFWFTTEYLLTGSEKGTKIASFSFTESCTPPSTEASGFAVTVINDNDMSFNWIRGNGDAVIVVVSQGTPVNMVPEFGSSYTADANFGDGSEIGTGNFVVYNGNGTEVTITGLTPGTNYYIAFYEYFTLDNCYSNTGYFAAAPCVLCKSSGNDIRETGITLVDFNTIHNVSAKPSGYSDYTGISTDLEQGLDYDLAVNLNTDGVYTIYARVWIDWNQNCDFNDSGETYELGSTFDNSDGPTSSSPLKITVPIDAAIGNTTMRVSAKYESAATSCSSDFDGEVEEYTLNITSPIPREPIAEFSSGAGTIAIGGSVDFTDESNYIPTSWSWTFEGGSPASSTDQNPTHVVYNTAGKFDVTLIATNAQGNDSEIKTEYINVIEVKAPVDLVATVTDKNVALSWTASSSDISGYKIYRTGGTSQTFTITDPHQTTYSDVNLSTGNYEYYVTAIYAIVGQESVPSNSQSVVIGDPNAIVPIDNESLVLIFPNPGEGLFNIEFKTAKLLKLKMAVYSGNGQLIAEYGYKNITNGVRKTIDLRRKEKGIYYLKIEMDDKVVTKQIVINN